MEMVIFSAALLAFLVIALIMLFRQRRKKADAMENGTGNEKKNADEPLVHSIKELIPLQYYDKKHGYYVSGDKLIDIIRIQSKDLVNMSESDLQYDMLRLSKWYKTYADDVKILSLNFPADTHVQQEYLNRKLASTNNPQRRHWIERKTNEEIWLGDNKTVREYYIIFFSESAEEHQKNKNRILSALQTGVTGLAEEIDQKQKDKVWQALCNKYTVLH